jgi:hypothetical protein
LLRHCDTNELKTCLLSYYATNIATLSTEMLYTWLQSWCSVSVHKTRTCCRYMYTAYVFVLNCTPCACLVHYFVFTSCRYATTKKTFPTEINHWFQIICSRFGIPLGLFSGLHSHGYPSSIVKFESFALSANKRRAAKARNPFGRSKTGIAGSNPTRSMNFLMFFLRLCCPV